MSSTKESKPCSGRDRTVCRIASSPTKTEFNFQLLVVKAFSHNEGCISTVSTGSEGRRCPLTAAKTTQTSLQNRKVGIFNRKRAHAKKSLGQAGKSLRWECTRTSCSAAIMARIPFLNAISQCVGSSAPEYSQRASKKGASALQANRRARSIERPIL